LLGLSSDIPDSWNAEASFLIVVVNDIEHVAKRLAIDLHPLGNADIEIEPVL